MEIDDNGMGPFDSFSSFEDGFISLDSEPAPLIFSQEDCDATAAAVIGCESNSLDLGQVQKLATYVHSKFGTEALTRSLDDVVNKLSPDQRFNVGVGLGLSDFPHSVLTEAFERGEERVLDTQGLADVSTHLVVDGIQHIQAAGSHMEDIEPGWSDLTFLKARVENNDSIVRPEHMAQIEAVIGHPINPRDSVGAQDMFATMQDHFPKLDEE